MSTPDTDSSKRQPRSRLLERAVTKLLMRPVRVSGVEAPSPHFRLIDLEGDSLKGCAWSPGQKIQVKLDQGLMTRTYTPIQWDSTQGSTRIVTYGHGDGPGSNWSLSVAEGEKRFILGPRRSLDLTNMPSTVIFFGDETSLGLASALRRSTSDGHTIQFVFEVTSSSECHAVLERLCLSQATLIDRLPDDGHLAKVQSTIASLLDGPIDVVLSGNASSIQYLHRALRQRGIAARRLRTKVYWARGRAGLD